MCQIADQYGHWTDKRCGPFQSTIQALCNFTNSATNELEELQNDDRLQVFIPKCLTNFNYT